MNQDLLNYACFVAGELRAKCQPNKQLYQTGNMKSSIFVVVIDENTIDVIIAVPYASYTDTRGRTAGWVEQTIDRCARCYSGNNQVDNVLGDGGVDISLAYI